MNKTLVAVSAMFLAVEAIAIVPLSAMAIPTSAAIELAQAKKPLPPTSATTQTPTAPLSFGLADGTPIKLKFRQEVSSKTAQPNDSVDFEVAEDVRVNNVLVIAKGANARGFVKEVRRPGMLGRKGKLDIAVKEVDLVSGERVSLRGNQESGGGTAGGIIAVAAIINPLALLFKGKNVTYQAGAEVNVFVDGNFELDRTKFSRAR
jgi:hypothetical protein